MAKNGTAPRAKPQPNHPEPHLPARPPKQSPAPSESLFRFIFFYPIYFTSLIYLFTLEPEVVHTTTIEKMMYGDVKLVNSILLEHKLMDRWMTGSKMTPNITSSFLDEGNVRRYIVGFTLAGYEMHNMLTYLHNSVKHEYGEKADIDSSFYIGGPFFDQHFEVNQVSAKFSKMTIVTFKVKTATTNFVWRNILKLAPIGVDWYLHDCVNKLGEEVKSQHLKKLKAEKDFGVEVEEDDEGGDEVKETNESGEQ